MVFGDDSSAAVDKFADLITLLNLEVLNVTVLRNVTPCILLNI